MTSIRIAENQLSRRVLNDIAENKADYTKYTNEISSGYVVSNPGDSKFASTIAQYREALNRIAGHTTRINAVKAQISFQDNVIDQVSELLVRAKELASQAANETVGDGIRLQMSKEVFEIRDHLINLANSKYQSKYVYAGLEDGLIPYTAQAAQAYNPPGGTVQAAQRYTYLDTTTYPAAAMTKSVNVTDEVSVTVNTPGNQIFDRSIQALERLGRALAGYSTNPASGTPDGTGATWTFPQDKATQTAAILDSLNLLETARQNDIMPERVSLGARLRRLETASSMLELTKADAEAVLGNLQDADYATSATNLTQAQNALEASYTVSAKVLNLNILDYI